MKYIKKELPSYNLHMIKTDKFKSTYIEVIFSNEIKKENITINNFLSSYLTYSTKKYNNKIKYARKLEELYAASVFSNVDRLGKMFNVDFNMRVLNDKYTEDGLLKQAVDFLYEVLFNPNVVNDEFDKDVFKVIKNNEQSRIERFKENQRDYSILKLYELFDKDAPYAFNLKGYIEDLNKITPKNLYSYYKEFIKCNNIDIFIIGDIDFDETENIFTNKFKFNNKKDDSYDAIIECRRHRKERQEVVEKDNTNQAKLSIACTIEDITKFEKEYVLNLYNIILGGSADSKLFKNIREKYSLCYYASSNANKLDNVLTISSGINKENYSKMLILIDKEMKDMEKGKFSDEELDNAIKYYISALDEIDDKPVVLLASYYAIAKLGVASIEERKKKIKTVTREDIMALAKKIHIDTIFLLGGDKK